MDETINVISLLAAATTSDRETDANLPTTAASLETEPSLANKHILASLRENPHIERLLGQCKIGGSMSKNREPVEPPRALTTDGCEVMTPGTQVLNVKVRRWAML